MNKSNICRIKIKICCVINRIQEKEVKEIKEWNSSTKEL